MPRPKDDAPARAAAPPHNHMTYSFGASRTDGDETMRDLLGGKGANLAGMTAIGLPVPPGFTITTTTCALYNTLGRMPDGLMADARARIAILEAQLGKRFGDSANPLLVSVRSGAKVSMPGMMDTILNLGLTDDSTRGLAAATGNERFAYDSYRRLINMFGDVVMGVAHDHFESAFDEIKHRLGATLDTDVPADGLKDLCENYKQIYRHHTGKPFPQDPYTQLELAIEAVFKSWSSEKAIAYRRIEGITGLPGTAVNVQSMVYGNMGPDSGTGVAFTRNPATGDNEFFGEFLVNAQGEDVVAGIRTPQPVAEMPAWNAAVHTQLLRIKDTLEHHYRDMQDIEFTVERGTLYMLQTRSGKRTGAAAVKIACDLVREGLISETQAILRVPAGDLTQLLLPSFDHKRKAAATTITRGLPASPGAAVGHPAFTAEEAVDRARAGEKVILIRKETSPEDVSGMHSAAGVLTSTGGMTSHAAVVARGWGKCCVVGAGAIRIDADTGVFSVGSRVYSRKDTISIDGSTGEVIDGALPTVQPELGGDFAQLMEWAGRHMKMTVRTNADTPADARRAREFGAQGIGLCRTEHMFFDGERITPMREMILAASTVARERALQRLLPFQRQDFIDIFKAMDGLPVTIRLLDPPLHEFLPHEDGGQNDLARDLDVPVEAIRARVTALHEANPMLGHRGCRLAITYPEIARMQTRAITEAAIECSLAGITVLAEIMVPLIGTRAELAILRTLIEQKIDKVRAERKFTGDLNIIIGTMIEIPRAALLAADIAHEADFFSFGTNDLTQLTYGYSRDDASTFLPAYIDQDILPTDPFQSIDQAGVGELITFGIERGRATRPSLKIGICGEHGGDPASVHFCHRAGMDYVSCSPYRVPIARLAAAQAALRDAMK